MVAEREIDDPGVDPDDDHPARPAPQAGADAASLKILMFALQGLSQRTIIALSNIFLVSTAFASLGLWYLVLEDPSVLKLVGATLCSLFVLALEHVRKRPG